MKVGFLLGGTEPAGLNQLYSLLREHPGLCMPREPQPEPNFFSKTAEFQKGPDHYHQRFFSHYQGGLAGEKSGRYLWHPEAPARIQSYNPAMKMLFILRDPIDRAFSNYRFNCLNGIERLSFGQAVARERERTRAMADQPGWRDVQPFAYFDKGLYGRQLARFREVMGPDRLFLVRNDALARDPEGTVDRVLAFLGLERGNYRLPTAVSDYPSYHVHFRWVQAWLRRFSPSLLERAIMAKRSGRPASFWEWLLQRNLSARRGKAPADLARRLREEYASDLDLLESLVPFSIADWRAAP